MQTQLAHLIADIESRRHQAQLWPDQGTAYPYPEQTRGAGPVARLRWIAGARLIAAGEWISGACLPESPCSAAGSPSP